ncbi:LysR family transcriptional regulator [Inhella crocodyli]|uniref:LysR family transcriptional regulator n=1 Tax=Inhella crocodyli TaxID=2499851 RepID=A0A437LRM9_9BURK|nr:LysR family transcriptional regulator [Inhella crocodyli]RVT88045.1 LysR family transcriptional regulator [Inhella crocodyli]
MNYHHLHYFWVVATEGGMARAAERLGVAVQTVSAQVHQLERALGVSLFKPEGRGLTLTEAGQVALAQAQQIFQLGAQLPEAVRAAAQAPTLRLAVGLADGLPKLLVHQVLSPVLGVSNLRLQCFEDNPDDLLAALALHRLDLVLADRPPAANPNLRLYTHRLGGSGMGWYAAPELHAKAASDFPRSMAGVPVLLPTAHAAVRTPLDRWFQRLDLRPQVVGEFQDSALLKTFGASGLGVFPAVDAVHEHVVQRYGVLRVGAIEGVEEQVWAIGTEKRVQHPLVAKLLAGTGPKTAS